MTIAAASHVASHTAASQVIPQGKSNEEQQILLLLVLAAVVIFIQTDRSGKSLDGTQFAALGIVGFVLLVLAQFWPEVALTFTILFVVSVILNSPNGVPFIGGKDTSLLTPNEAVTQPDNTGGAAVKGVSNSAGNPLNKTNGEVAQ